MSRKTHVAMVAPILAIILAMSGGRPEYFPVLLAMSRVRSDASRAGVTQT